MATEAIIYSTVKNRVSVIFGWTNYINLVIPHRFVII